MSSSSSSSSALPSSWSWALVHDVIPSAANKSSTLSVVRTVLSTHGSSSCCDS